MDLFNTKKIAQLQATVTEQGQMTENLISDLKGLFTHLLRAHYPQTFKQIRAGNVLKRVDINNVEMLSGNTMNIDAYEAMITPKRTRKGKIEQALKAANEIMLASAEKIKDMTNE